MQIQSVNQFNISNKKTQPVKSFKGANRRVFSQTGGLLYRTTTSIFRYDLNWKQLFGIFAKEKPDKIYCYACSDGSEPYSIAIGLFELFGKNKAKKFFPIIARDIDLLNIEACKKGRIDITLTDICDTNIFLGKGVIDKYFPWHYNGFSRVRHANDDLRSVINFQQADFIADAENLDYTNSIIFCRNVWPYFSRENVSKLAKIFANKFTDKTKLVLGNFDITTNNSFVLNTLKYEGNLVEDLYCPQLLRKKT